MKEVAEDVLSDWIFSQLFLVLDVLEIDMEEEVLTEGRIEKISKELGERLSENYSIFDKLPEKKP